jgi:hypothetical protein
MNAKEKAKELIEKYLKLDIEVGANKLGLYDAADFLRSYCG